MTDIFLPEEFGDMFRNQHIVILGGSQMRGLYKDMVWLLNHASLIPNEVLGAKSEQRFPEMEKTDWKDKPCEELYEIFNKDNRDILLDTKGLTSGRTYIEPRQYYNKKYNICMNYRFIVRTFSDELKEFLLSYEEKYKAPIGTIIMNSTLWDINRFGPFCNMEYKKNINQLLEIVPQVLPKDDGSFFWLTCPIIAEETQSRGMNVPGLEFQCFYTRYNVVEANRVAAEEVIRAGYGVIDIHYLLLLQQFRRKRDGIHWDAYANRMMTNRVLTMIQLWRRGEGEDHGLTGRISDDNNSEMAKDWEKKNFALEMAKLQAKKIKEGPKSEEEIRKTLEELESCLDPFKDDCNVSRELRDSITDRVIKQKMDEREKSKKGEYQNMRSYFPPDKLRYQPYPPQNRAVVPPMNIINPAFGGGRAQAPPRFDEDTELDIDFRRGGDRGYDMEAIERHCNQPNNTDLVQEEYTVMNNMLRQEIRSFLMDSGGEYPTDNWITCKRRQIIERLVNPMQAMQSGADEFNRMAQGGFQRDGVSGPMRQQRMGFAGMSGAGMMQNMQNQNMNGFGNWNQGMNNGGGGGGGAPYGYGGNNTWDLMNNMQAMRNMRNNRGGGAGYGGGSGYNNCGAINFF